MNADLTMVAVKLHGVLSHDRDCKAIDGGSKMLPIFKAAVSLLPPTDSYHRAVRRKRDFLVYVSPPMLPD